MAAKKLTFGKHTLRFRALCALHARAYLACDAFVEAALGEDMIATHDQLFGKGTFFPEKLLQMSKKELRKAWRLAKLENRKK
jgi:hypothetical protein